MSTASDDSICSNDQDSDPQWDNLIIGLHHINVLVPPRTLHLAVAFYGGVLGLTPANVPQNLKAHLAWFDIGYSGQQIHITSEHHLSHAQMKAQSESPRHPCFKVPTEAKLNLLQQMIWKLYEDGLSGAPVYCDTPGEDNSGRGPTGDFPKRFFARDYAGNRLEFSL